MSRKVYLHQHIVCQCCGRVNVSSTSASVMQVPSLHKHKSSYADIPLWLSAHFWFARELSSRPRAYITPKLAHCRLRACLRPHKDHQHVIAPALFSKPQACLRTYAYQRPQALNYRTYLRLFQSHKHASHFQLAHAHQHACSVILSALVVTTRSG